MVEEGVDEALISKAALNRADLRVDMFATRWNVNFLLSAE
jgi:hypothetical protein